MTSRIEKLTTLRIRTSTGRIEVVELPDDAGYSVSIVLTDRTIPVSLLTNMDRSEYANFVDTLAEDLAEKRRQTGREV